MNESYGTNPLCYGERVDIIVEEAGGEKEKRKESGECMLLASLEIGGDSQPPDLDRS